ncbi:hypothetical protein ACFL96_07800 [Thermoproteota archaeon]
MRKTWRRAGKKGFVAGGIGKYGPYTVGIKKIGRNTSVKATAGTRGVTVGVRHKVNKKLSVEGKYNLVTQKPSVTACYKKKKIPVY